MKTIRVALAMVLAAAVFSITTGQSAESDSASNDDILTIESIQIEGGHAIVTVRVPTTYKRVVLESRQRLEGGSWNPRLQQTVPTSTEPFVRLVFSLQVTDSTELLRARGENAGMLPASFYTGTNTFAGQLLGNPNEGAYDQLLGPPSTTVPTAGPGAGDSRTREVVESDIWKIDGDTMYFFNQFRGLQVIDVSNPDAPIIMGTHEMVAAGEQMYLLDSTHLILLTRDHCGYSSTTAESEVVILNVADGVPEPVVSLPVPGSIRESRLVGTALYVVSQQYRQREVSGDTRVSPAWEVGSHVTSFDLSDPANPAAKSSAWVPGYNNAIMATDRFLFVAAPASYQNWWNSSDIIHVFDISSPDGSMASVSTFTVGGRVLDKFKMNLKDDIFTVVVENRSNGLRTVVETFSLALPAKPIRLGSLLIIEGEQLHATRFAGDLLYAVTFFRIDPLWIIDLSIPAQPRKVGELEIPGWSTYIHPLGNKLVTIGIDTTEGWRTTVQLFDVSDPAQPTLASKVFVGERYSSSEANSDEKAFAVLPEEGLVMVPFNSWNESKQVHAVQLIDLHEMSLTKRGIIEHDLQPRRAAVHQSRILSISGRELLTVDASDRDHPVVTSELVLSWAADSLKLAGDFLIQFTTPWNAPPAIRVTSAEQPRAPLHELELDELPFLGASLKANRLYVLQGRPAQVIYPQEWNPTNYLPIATNMGSFKLSVYDAAGLPELTLRGETTTETDLRFYGRFEPTWLENGTLIWNAGGGGGMYLPYSLQIHHDAVFSLGMPVSSGMAPSLIGAWFASQPHLLAYSFSSGAPELVSLIDLSDGTNSWGNFSKAFASGDLVFVSHRQSEYDPHLENPPRVYGTWDGTKWSTTTNDVPPGGWIQKYYLNVINYADPKEPVIRDPINIPGTLSGISHGGALLYTTSGAYTDLSNYWSSWQETLQVSAYDEFSAHLVDTLPLPQQWPRTIAVHDGHIFLGVPGTSETKAALETWVISDAGKLTKAGSLQLDYPAHAMNFFGDLLAVSLPNQIQLIDATTPSSLQSLNSQGKEGCVAYQPNHADGALDRGLWLPLGIYGVMKIAVQNN